MAKKILKMAIAFIMICSLFAMPAMAVNTYGSEIITDGGAEVDLPYTDGVKAIMASNATLTRTNSVAYENHYSLKLEASSVTNNAELFLMYLPVTPGKTYELSYDILAYDVTPGYTGANMQRVTATYRTATGSSAGTASSATFYDLFINNGYWTKKTVTYAIPNDATITHVFPKIMLPGSARLTPGGTVTGAYIDDISFREVLSSTPDENLVPNSSFEDIVYASASYTNTNGFVPQYFDTASNGYTDLYIYGRGDGYTADGVTAHSGNNFIGLKALKHQFRMTSPFAAIEYGKTYVCSVWFNGKNLTNDSVYPQIMVAGKASSGAVSGFTAVLQDFKDAYAVDGWQQLSFEFTTPEFVEGTTNCDLCQVVLIMNGTDGTIGYFDDLSIVEKKVVEPTEYDVTISGENAVTSVAAATSKGEAVNFTVAPKFGYYIQSITIGGVDFNGFDAYKGGTYSTGAIETDTEIVVTVAALSENTEEGVSTDVATLPAVFAPTADSAVTFGKVLDTTDATSWGIELKKDGVGVTPYHGGSYLYKAFATNANGQYAIEFIGLEAGEYTIRSYVYVNGTATFGAPTTFVVE